jgi:uncharacterized protein (TIGR02996 family)
MIQPRVFTVTALLLTCMGASFSTRAQSDCGDPFRNHFGPFDYRSATKDTLALVERVHFTLGIETMTRPGTTMFSHMAGDVAYTLEVFPNHHRALVTMRKLGERHKTDKPPGANFTVECYFRRSVQFRPKDITARLLYADYLIAQNRHDEARHQIQAAASEPVEFPFTDYNIGRLYLDLKDYDKALEHARRAMAAGFPRTDLKDALMRAGKWVEQQDSAASSPGAPPPTSASASAP